MNYIKNWNLEHFNKHFKAYLSHLYEKDVEVNSFSIAGEGNMNFTFRLGLTDSSTIIFKQAPPFCAKFPDIPAPLNRISNEKKFYDLISTSEKLSQYSPRVIAFDKNENALYMNDLGEGKDYEDVYALKKISEDDLIVLAKYLSDLHKLDISGASFTNQDMRELNYNYIFKLPYDKDDNSIDLDTITMGLNQILIKLKKEKEVIDKIHSLGDRYLYEKKCLIHGDFYPRSWLKTDSGIYVIDPEFAFIGLAEFDVGVLLAHMAMSQDFQRVYETLRNNYTNEDFSWDLALDFCAVEILRRVFYVSQLPIVNEISFKQNLYDAAIRRLKDSQFKLEGLLK